AGGELGRAARYAEIAADRASAALAFDRAAALYKNAFDWTSGDSSVDRESLRALQHRQATALANAGRCADAARLLLVAPEGAPGDHARELRYRATEQFLVGGHLDEGTAVLVPLLAEVGLRYPRTTLDSIFTVLGLFARIRLRGYSYEERPVNSIDS